MKKSRVSVLIFVVFAVVFLVLCINAFNKRVNVRETELQHLQDTVLRLENIMSRLEGDLRDVFVKEFMKNPYAALSEYTETVGPYLARVKHSIGESGFTSEEKTLAALHARLEKEVSVARRNPEMLTVTDFPFGVPIFSACIFTREDVKPLEACNEYLGKLAPFYYDALRQYHTMNKGIF